MSRWRSAPGIAEGIRLFDAGETRAAHEAWESAWREHRGEAVGEVARALSQWAAACVHRERGRETGFRGLAAKCAAALDDEALDERFDTRPLAAWIARAAAGPAEPGRLRPLPG